MPGTPIRGSYNAPWTPAENLLIALANFPIYPRKLLTTKSCLMPWNRNLCYKDSKTIRLTVIADLKKYPMEDILI